MMYLVFYPSDDQKVRNCVDSWLKEMGGSASLKAIEQKFRERFKYFITTTHTQEEWDKQPRTDHAYKLENEMVSAL